MLVISECFGKNKLFVVFIEKKSVKKSKVSKKADYSNCLIFGQKSVKKLTIVIV